MTRPPGSTRALGVALAAVALGATAAAGDVAAERATLARLEARAKGLYELIARGQREQAAGQWASLAAELEAFSARLEDDLARMKDEVAERDEDLTALLRSPRWREPEIMSLVATYHLAWVRYQGAQLVGEEATKKKLLRKAIAGFSQFLLVNEVPEIYGESLYGRGLAFLDLGDTAKASEDLRAAAEEPGVGPRARAALAEAGRRAAGSAEQARAEDDPEVLLGRLAELLPRAAGGEAAAEKSATDLARGLAARAGSWPSRVERTVAAQLGGGSTGPVRSTYGAFLLAQLAVDRDRCADVPPLAAASAAVQDASRARWRPELLFLEAGCLLNGGRAREAADRFAALLRDHPDAPRAREAAYYRFRALDVTRTRDPGLTAAYEEALAAYLARWERTPGGAEARFLLAELHRSRGDCDRAGAEYGRVTAEPFGPRARLGALECRAAALAGAEASPARRAEVRDALGTFARETSDGSLAARATLLAALVAAGGSPPDHAAVVDLLDGFEARHPEAHDLHAAAREERLVAHVASGQVEEARADLEAVLAAPSGDERRRRILGRIARDLATRALRAPAAGPALDLSRRVQAAVVEADGDARERVVLADLELRAGDATAARRHFEQALQDDAGSAEALRGAARAAAAAGDQPAALAYWRRVADASAPGGTGWYEARLAQVDLLADGGKQAEACAVLRASRGQATSAGGDQLDARLRALEPGICR